MLTIRQMQIAEFEAQRDRPAVISCERLKIWVRLEVDPEDPNHVAERFVLRGPGYRSELDAQGNCERPAAVIDLVYHGIRRGVRYTLEVRPDGDRPAYTIFENLTFDEICGFKS